LLGVLLTVLCLLLLAGGVAYWGWRQFTDQATTAMNQHPVIQRCIGHIEHVSLDWSATSDDERDDSFAFRVRGTRGSGLVDAVFTTVSDDEEHIDEGELHMDNGKTLSLDADDKEDDDSARNDSCS